MNLLLDTHILLWWLDDYERILPEAKDVITDGRNSIFVSSVVIWEIRIKQTLGKLNIPNNFREVLDRQPFEMLAITAEHAYEIGNLPLIHRDPFDRMLAAQAKVEAMTLLTRDSHLKMYDIRVIEA